ncbi:MAG: AraC family transcriptional regulator ligand-binding domain-containing protein [Deltaproteobacteria bacterium]|nr:AraC family transcriptional regulator ligand-binding domain-containing protein [Deltaproteobacteria bacterium]
MQQPFTIGVGWVNRFYQSLMDWGVSEEKIYHLSKLRQKDLKNTDDRIPIEHFIKLGRVAPELTGLPEIGLILGQQASFKNIGIIFKLAIQCETVRESLHHVVRYSNLGNEVAKARFDEEKDFSEWSEQYISSRYLCIPLVEFECCQKLKVFHSVLGKNFHPVQAKFQYDQPDYIGKYLEIFQAPLLFNQEKSGIVFDSKFLTMPNPNPDPYIKAILSRHAENLSRDLESSKGFKDKVRMIIMNNLESGKVNLDMIAKKLNVSSRTVYRQLKAENISYKTLLNDVQKQLAQTYLKEASISINDISFLLGFSEASAFHRAFKRWFGMNPGQYRRKIGKDHS